jgi:adenosylhomocysteinase
MTAPQVADVSLAIQGRLHIEWAESRMPVLMALRRRYEGEKPLRGHRIAGCVHVTKETAVLIRTLLAAGAEVSWTGGNQVTTQDDVAAALGTEGVRMYSWRGMSKEEMNWGLEQTIRSLTPSPTLLVDDGADLICLVHSRMPQTAKQVVGGTDKTTSGVRRLRAMACAQKLLFPIIGVNDVVTKWDFDNTFGTGQSTIDGILRATCILLAGKVFVVAGFGHVGRGVALRARGMGCQVIVTCIHATTALKALLEGFRVMPMDDAAKIGDIFCTTTGMKYIIVGRHFDKMKDSAVLCNAGHSDCELNLADLDQRTKSKREVRPNMIEHTLRNERRLYLLAEGGLVNLAAAEGNSSEVMDLSFANQFLGLLRLVREAHLLEKRVYDLTDEQDQEIARVKLDTMGVHIDHWTEEQSRYATNYIAGT